MFTTDSCLVSVDDFVMGIVGCMTASSKAYIFPFPSFSITIPSYSGLTLKIHAVGPFA